MSDTAVAPIEKKRAMALKAMPEALQEVAHDLEAKLGRGSAGIITIQYNMGCRINDVLKDEGKYGSKAIEQLAEYLPLPGSTPKSRQQMLYSLKNLASEFEREFIDSWSKKPMANGHFLELSHWLQLMKLKSRKDQEKMLGRILKNSLSSLDLEKEVRAGAGGGTKNTRQGGRKPKTPSSAIAGLQATFTMANKLANYEPVVEENVFGVIEEMPADEVTEVLLANLEKTVEALETTAEKVEAMKEKGEECLERVKGILADRDEAGGAEDEDEDEKPAKKTKAKGGKEKAGKEKAGPSKNGKAKGGKKAKVPAGHVEDEDEDEDED